MSGDAETAFEKYWTDALRTGPHLDKVDEGVAEDAFVEGFAAGRASCDQEVERLREELRAMTTRSGSDQK